MGQSTLQVCSSICAEKKPQLQCTCMKTELKKAEMSFNNTDARNRVLVGHTMFKMWYKQKISYFRV